MSGEPRTPLTFIDGLERYDADSRSVLFVGQDAGGKRITCSASEEGLADLERLQAMGPAVLDIYLANTALIHGIAQEKFARKRVRADGVLVISSGDLLPYG